VRPSPPNRVFFGGVWPSTTLRLDKIAGVDGGEELAAAQRTIRQLVEALDTRTVIGQATGMMMERYQLSSEVAFATLCQLSSERNRKVRDIAAELVAKGQAEGC
jgi:AmiR/NasT family two-component response regulator